MGKIIGITYPLANQQADTPRNRTKVLSTMTKNELLVVSQEIGLTVSNDATKAEIIKLIEAKEKEAL